MEINKNKIIATILITGGISFMIITNLSKIGYGGGFIMGSIIAFIGFYILIKVNKKQELNL